MLQCLEWGALMEFTCSSRTHSQRGASQDNTIGPPHSQMCSVSKNPLLRQPCTFKPAANLQTNHTLARRLGARLSGTEWNGAERSASLFQPGTANPCRFRYPGWTGTRNPTYERALLADNAGEVGGLGAVPETDERDGGDTTAGSTGARGAIVAANGGTSCGNGSAGGGGGGSRSNSGGAGGGSGGSGGSGGQEGSVDEFDFEAGELGSTERLVLAAAGRLVEAAGK
eukprot:330017-Chlamydomonas_euryale.AAC.2